MSDKLEVIENLIPRVDALLIGGAMAYTFLKARGVPVGKSLVEADLLDTARDVDGARKARGLRLELPVDHVVAPKLEAGAPAETLDVGDPAIGDRMGLDIGPQDDRSPTATVIAGAKTVIWNGPMGVFEIDAFANGTHRGRAGGRRREGHDGHRRRRFDRRGRARPASPIGSRTSRPAAARRSSSSAAGRCRGRRAQVELQLAAAAAEAETA